MPTQRKIRTRLKYYLLFGLLVSGLLLLNACSSEPETTAATLSPLAAEGEQVFKQNCASCHAISQDTVIVGPSLDGVATRAGSRIEGLDARTYIELSVLQPDAYLVEGFDNLMPNSLGKSLSSEQLNAMVAYLLTLE